MSNIFSRDFEGNPHAVHGLPDSPELEQQLVRERAGETDDDEPTPPRPARRFECRVRLTCDAVAITSPRTGRELSVSHNVAPQDVRGKIVQARGAGKATVHFTPDELKAFADAATPAEPKRISIKDACDYAIAMQRKRDAEAAALTPPPIKPAPVPIHGGWHRPRRSRSRAA